MILLGICQSGFSEYKGRCYKYYKGMNLNTQRNIGASRIRQQYQNSEYISNWDEARYACINLSNGEFRYDLVSIHDLNENQFLVSLMLQDDPDLGVKHYNFPWVGLHCISSFKTKYYSSCSIHATTQENWQHDRWIDGSALNFTNWKSGEPSKKKVCSILIVMVMSIVLKLSFYWF